MEMFSSQLIFCLPFRCQIVHCVPKSLSVKNKTIQNYLLSKFYIIISISAHRISSALQLIRLAEDRHVLGCKYWHTLTYRYPYYLAELFCLFSFQFISLLSVLSPRPSSSMREKRGGRSLRGREGRTLGCSLRSTRGWSRYRK